MYRVKRLNKAPGWHRARNLARIDQLTAGDILIHSSTQLTTALMEDDRLEEWRLMVSPIVVSPGKRCFGDPGETLPLPPWNRGR
jgi:hypothetical protein